MIAATGGAATSSTHSPSGSRENHTGPAEGIPRAPSSLWRVCRGLLSTPSGIAGTVIVLVLVVSAVFAPELAPKRPVAMDLPARFEGPSLSHWFGTDEFGRDVLSRVMYGGRVSLVVGVSAVAIGGTIGTVVGLLGGYYGRGVDQVAMRSMDTLFAFPAVLSNT